jgi:hypothetical protein
VDATLLLGFRHALHAVYARLVAQITEHIRAFHLKDHFLESAKIIHALRNHLGLPPLRFSVACVHAVEVGGKESGFVPARACTNLDDRIVCIHRVLGDKRDGERLFERGQTLLDLLHFTLCERAHFFVLVFERRSCTRKGGLRLAHGLGFCQKPKHTGVRTGCLFEFFPIRNHIRIGERMFKTQLFLVFFLDQR